MSEYKKLTESKFQMYYGSNQNIQSNAKDLRKQETKAEENLWNYLKNRQILGLKFRRQHPIDIFIADFYCHEKRLVIEVDGEIHNTPDNKIYDLNRTDELNNHNIKVIRFTNHQVINNVKEVISEIKKFIQFDCDS